MRKSFASNTAPLLVGVIKEEKINQAIASIKNAQLCGAQAFDLHLSPFSENDLTVENLSNIMKSTEKPILAVHYNEAFDRTRLNFSDEERLRQMLIALDAGAAGIDMQGYTFEPNGDTISTLTAQKTKDNMSFVKSLPNEVTLNPETVAKQKDLINRVHKKGGEVLLSTHTGCFLDCGQTLDLTDYLHERKPDVIKLVNSCCDSEEQLAEYFKTILKLKNRYNDTKIHYHCNGKFGKYTRIIGPMLGSYIAFCVENYNESSIFEQLPLGVMKSVYDLISKI